jgi:hypothetical protein
MKTDSKAYRRALRHLEQPGARLVLTFSPTRSSGRAYCILPRGAYIADSTALALLKRPDVHPFDQGLFADRPQSWRLGE